MENKKRKIAGVIPAAGSAMRISPIPCSKEIFPVGFSENDSDESPKIKVAVAHLLESFAVAQAEQIYMVLQKGKWDIPQYLGLGLDSKYSLAYIITEPTKGTHYTIDLSFTFVKDRIVLLGFPDILFTPKDGFVALLDRQQQTNADVVLGLFKATNPSKADMVDVDERGRVRNIIIKPRKTSLKYTWTIAVWTPAFSTFLHQYIDKEKRGNENKSGNKTREIYIGDVILDAVKNNLIVDTVLFSEGEYIDIGTVPDLKKALISRI